MPVSWHSIYILLFDLLSLKLFTKKISLFCISTIIVRYISIFYCPCTPCPSPQVERSKVESRHFAHHWLSYLFYGIFTGKKVNVLCGILKV